MSVFLTTQKLDMALDDLAKNTANLKNGNLKDDHDIQSQPEGEKPKRRQILKKKLTQYSIVKNGKKMIRTKVF